MQKLLYNKFLKKNYPVPYIYKLKNRKCSIVCVGTMHTFDKNDQQFKVVDKEFEIFLSLESVKKHVFIEAVTKDRLGKLDSIKQKGEMGYMNYLCRKNKIPFSTPEPTNQEWYEELTKKFPRKVVAYYDFVRICFQWHNTDKSINFPKYIKPFLENSRKDTDWKDVDFTLKGMSKIHEELFNEKMN